MLVGSSPDGQEVVIEFNRDHMIGAHVQYWTGVRKGRGKFSTTRSAAELNTIGIPVVWIAGQTGYVALTHVEPVPHQPDDIEEYDDKTVPDPARAAERVLAYVTEFGDGLYDVTGGAPLYGRDLVAVAKSAELIGTVRTIAETWRTDPGAYPDGAADPLEQIATVLLGPRSTRKR